MSVEIVLNTDIVYVILLDEGVDVMRPVLAHHVDANIYVLIRPDDYDPDDETWEFLPESRVVCNRIFKGEKIYLLASSLA